MIGTNKASAPSKLGKRSQKRGIGNTEPGPCPGTGPEPPRLERRGADARVPLRYERPSVWRELLRSPFSLSLLLLSPEWVDWWGAQLVQAMQLTSVAYPRGMRHASAPPQSRGAHV